MNQKTLSAANPKLRAAAAPAALACLLVAFAAGCGLVSRSNTQPADAATRPASLAPAASPGKVESPLPAPTGFVNDYAKVLDDEPQRLLEEKLRRLKERGNVEFAVVTVETTGERGIDDYSLAVAKGWGVGPPSGEEGGGLLLLVAVKDRHWRVQTGERLRPDLPDAAVAEICQAVIPFYRDGRYAEGVAKCVDGLTARLVEKRKIKLD